MIATCRQLPELDPDDRLLVRALEERGVRVTAAVWDDPAVDWSAADACVVRSTWDYHKHPARFAAWADATGAATLLLNPAPIIRWNMHKFYSRSLAERGIPIVPTLWLEKTSPALLDDILAAAGWPEAVIKPAYGASADGILHVGNSAAGRKGGSAHLARLLATQDVLVQPYLATLAEQHERALVFVAGEYSHAVTKTPFMHAESDLGRRALHPPGTSGELPVEPASDEIALAYRALQAAPAGHVFARVDIVPNDGAPLVLEVELIEPTLYLYASPSAATSLAAAIRCALR